MKKRSGGSIPGSWWEVRVVSWNCASLFPTNKMTRRMRHRIFGLIADQADILLLQETHGFLETFEVSELKRFLNDFHIFVGDPPDRATGGTATLIRKSKFKGFKWTKEELAPGRVLRVHGEGERGEDAKIWNVHNYKLGAGDVRRSKHKLEDDADEAANLPKHMLWIGGDWNFCDEEDSTFAPEAAENFFGNL